MLRVNTADHVIHRYLMMVIDTVIETLEFCFKMTQVVAGEDSVTLASRWGVIFIIS
jgi:hypothetical protein